MPPKAGRGKGKIPTKVRTQKRKAEKTKDLDVDGDCSDKRVVISKNEVSQDTQFELPLEDSRSQQSQESMQISTSPSPPSNTQPEPSDVEDESASSALPIDNSKSQCDKAQNEIPSSGVPYSFTEEQEEEIACWIESNKLLYDMKDRQYKDKVLRRHLWERKAEEYGINYDAILKWYKTQRTRFSKLREGQPIKKPQKKSGDGVSSGDEEDHIHVEEASENDSDRDRFIRRVFGFLKPHIRRHKKDTPASFKDKLALAETGEVVLSDDSTMTDNVADKSREHTKKYSGYPTPRLPSRTRKANGDQLESPTKEMRVTGASHDLQDRLVDFITREQQVSRATPFCKYLEAELDRLHDACMEPAYDEITTVLNHYRKVSRQFRMKEAAGDKINPLEVVPSAFQWQQAQQQGTVTVNPVSTSATFSRINQLQQETALPSGTYYSTSNATSLPSTEIQSGPKQWLMNPPTTTVWRSQECGYVQPVDQQQQYHPLQPASNSTQGYVPSPLQAALVQRPSQQQIGPLQLTPLQPVQITPPAPVQQTQKKDMESSA